jgi:hypothetical protein
MYDPCHAGNMTHMGAAPLLFPLAIVDTGDYAPHLAGWDWTDSRLADLSFCGRRVGGSSRRGFERGCHECAGMALSAGFRAVQGHDGVIFNLARVPRLTGRRRGIPDQAIA